ncbi:MAG: MBL fold metallo-hydrolase [Pseudomonadota bacterium]
MSKPELRYPYSDHPEPAQTVEVAPGVRWLTMPMGGSLTHINLYLLEDHDGWYVVDTGLALAEVAALWEDICAHALGDKPIKGVICTHMHPDHIGQASFLTDKYRCPLYMTRAEYYQARSFSNSDGRHHQTWHALDFYTRAGMPPAYLEQLRKVFESRRSDNFVMPTMPSGYERLQHGDTLRINGEIWQVVVGSGHSPEHACLHCPALGVLLSGDQILPVITSNVSVHPMEPNANPLRDWMESIDALLDLPDDTFVLPAHNLPFYGVRERLRDLAAHHEDRLLAVEEHCAKHPANARELLPVMFERELDPRQMMMALGEAIAHTHLLIHRNRLQRHLDADGVYQFVSIDPDLARRANPDAHDRPADGPVQV